MNAISNHENDLGPTADLNPERIDEASAEQLAKEADGILKRLERARVKSWSDWLQIAERLNGIALAAMRLSGANQRGGRGYNEMMARLLHHHALGDPRWKQTRAALLNIYENRADVETMRSRWDHDQQLRWQAPSTVWDKFSNRQKADDPRPRGKPAANRNHVLAELQEENDRLAAEIARLRAQLQHQFADLDAGEIVALLIEQCDADVRDAVASGLQENQGVPRQAASQVDDGWPLMAARRTL